jgi:hypothetical protein
MKKQIRGWVVTHLAFLALMGCCGAATAFQLAPMGSSFEARLTKETSSNLARVAGQVGVLLKSPVHEEITQLGFDCPADLAVLANDTLCSGADKPFASAFVIYGVRWNDLPPFMLSTEEGNCSYFGKTCRVDQTVRFSTQPVCWYCLFKDAEKKSQKQQIIGCGKGEKTVRGNVMTRSHFGDLQFLHGMAGEEKTAPGVTQEKILGWLEFAWRVSSNEVKPGQKLRDIDIPAINAHFGCTEWSVADLYILGRQDAKSGLLRNLRDIAFGSVLHTVQDSFAAGHTSREARATAEMCADTGIERPPRVLEFHTYAAQDGARHDEEDSRTAMTFGSSADRWPLAVDATRNLASYKGSKWNEVAPYMRCLFDLSPNAQESSPGEKFKRVTEAN